MMYVFVLLPREEGHASFFPAVCVYFLSLSPAPAPLHCLEVVWTTANMLQHVGFVFLSSFFLFFSLACCTSSYFGYF